MSTTPKVSERAPRQYAPLWCAGSESVVRKLPRALASWTYGAMIFALRVGCACRTTVAADPGTAHRVNP
ncbi:hypothetical protein, partial [Streptomyces pharetrae]|uniref:hypothetical protein n=1 Tax=Streptomyces pharetrae TaxID=291370 RepID=UPI00296E45C0